MYGTNNYEMSPCMHFLIFAIKYIDQFGFGLVSVDWSENKVATSSKNFFKFFDILVPVPDLFSYKISSLASSI